MQQARYAVRLGASLVALAVAGCASGPPPRSSTRTDDTPLSGRLAVRVDGPSPRSMSAVFDLRGDALAGTLDLSTPLGSVLAQARWAPGSVVLKTPRGESAYADMDALTRDALGESIPVGALFDWLRGRPWPGAASRASDPASDPASRSFEQLGWTVNLSHYDSGSVDALRNTPPQVSVRVRLDD